MGSKLGHEPPFALPLMHTQYRDLEPLCGKGKHRKLGSGFGAEYWV